MGEAKRRAACGEMPYQRGGHYDRDAEVRKLAAEMDQRVCQITAKAPSITDRALIEQMLGFLPGLQQIWATTSDDTLANLCSEYPGFYRYAKAMEDAFEAQRKNPGQHPFGAGIEELPDSVKPSLVQAHDPGRGAGARDAGPDRSARTACHAGWARESCGPGPDIARARDVAQLHRQWIAGMDLLADEAHTAGVPQPFEAVAGEDPRRREHEDRQAQRQVHGAGAGRPRRRVGAGHGSTYAVKGDSGWLQAM